MMISVFSYRHSCSAYGRQDCGRLRVHTQLTTLAGVDQYRLPLLRRLPHQWPVDRLRCPLLAKVCINAFILFISPLRESWSFSFFAPISAPILWWSSWVTTTSGCTRTRSSTCQWTPSTGMSFTTTRPWTTTSCWWRWRTPPLWMTGSDPSSCPQSAPHLVKCAWCPDGETSTLIQVRWP